MAVQYRMPAVTLDDAARELLKNYYWRGNIRQLKNVAEQISAIEQVRVITPEVLAKYLPQQEGGTAMAAAGAPRMDDNTMATERELLYKVLFDMRSDINDLKRMLAELLRNGGAAAAEPQHDIRALLPTSTQGRYVPAVQTPGAYGQPAGPTFGAPATPVYDQSPAPVYAESEEVTDEPPREIIGSVCPVSGIMFTVTMICSSACTPIIKAVAAINIFRHESLHFQANFSMR